jgi:acyl-CoA synthetase (AMP-forming)/AMP-acid ligase II
MSQSLPDAALSPAVNIAASLQQRARAQGNLLAITEPHGCERPEPPLYRHFTYRELDEESNRLARGLEGVGIRRGVRTVLMVRPSLEFFALTFALFKVGAVIVFIDPGMGVKNLGRCLEEAAPEAFIGIPRAHLGRLLFGWARRSIRTCVTVGPRLGWGGYTLAGLRRRAGDKTTPVMAELAPEEMCALLFTSGSTGVAKGVVYTHRIFNAQVEALRQMYGIEPGEIDLATFPLFALFAPALGMTAVIPEMDATRPGQVDPHKILGAIHHFKVTNLFGSPALLRRVGDFAAARGITLPSLRRVLSAGAPVPWQVLERFTSLLPEGVDVHTPYGATEALPVCTIGSSTILNETRHATARGAGVCVGRPVEGINLKIIRIMDEPIPVWGDDLVLPAGQVGEIAVQGLVVTASYHARPEQTALAKISDPARGGFYHRMGDLGYLDEEGRVWFCGRKSQRVQTASGPLYTIPCEGIFNTHPVVRRSALVGVPAGGASEPVLCVEPHKELSGRERERVRAELLQMAAGNEITRAIRRILFHPGFPVDVRHNAKIGREQLAAWAARQPS